MQNSVNSDPDRPANTKDITLGEISHGLVRTMKMWSQDYSRSDQFEINDVLNDMISQVENDETSTLDLSHLVGPRVPTQVQAEEQALGFAPDVEEFFDVLDEGEEAGATDNTRTQS